MNCGNNKELVDEMNCQAIEQSWTYTWVLEPQAGDVVVEVLDDPDVMEGVKLVKRKCSGGQLPDGDQAESTLLWTLIELQKSGQSHDGSLQYTWKFAPMNDNLQTAAPKNNVSLTTLHSQSNVEHDVNVNDCSENEEDVASDALPAAIDVNIATSSLCIETGGTVTIDVTDINLKSCATKENVKVNTVDDVSNKRTDFSLEVIAKEQQLDKDINVILQLKQQVSERPDWDFIASESTMTKSLWQQWSRLEVRGDVLFRKFEPLDGRSTILQIVMPHSMKHEFFKFVHGGINGGHMGRKRTEQQIQLRAFWPGWTGDVRRYMKMCDQCAQYHRGPPPKTASLKPFTAGEVWETVSIDITGPHPKSRQGYNYLLTAGM